MKKGVLIWGTGINGLKTYEFLKNHRQYCVVAFGDNNEDMWGQYIEGRNVIGPASINQLQGVDCIVIASQHWKSIREQLKTLTNIPIYNNVDEIMYSTVVMEITGFCNAKCKWCVTGYDNRLCGKQDTAYMTVERFKQIHQHLYNNNIIEKSSQISLYNWGEPLLNRDYARIIEYLCKEQQTFVMSTNASVVRSVEYPDAYKNCKAFVFSMPGFSQESYDNIHGFSFDKIKKNIEEIYKNIKENGFVGEASIAFHVYKFNIGEIEHAQNFANSLGLKFHPYYPYFNGNSMTEKYLEGNFSPEMLDEAEKDLFLEHVDALLGSRPSDYKCIFENGIFINCQGDMVLCCASDPGCKNYAWGKIDDIKSYDELRTFRREMLKSNTCSKCRKLRIDYWMEKNPSYVLE